MEWGAVAYLSHSFYGKNAEVWGNNSLFLSISGCAGDAPKPDAIPNSQKKKCIFDYVTTNGLEASTTGNIYGIYDMSGFLSEYVMGVMCNEDGTKIQEDSVYISGFDNDELYEMDKYIDKYVYGTSSNNYYRRQLGDATSETRGWYGNGNTFVTNNFPWFVRGGYSGQTSEMGLFSFTIRGPGSFGSRLIVSGNILR